MNNGVIGVTIINFILSLVMGFSMKVLWSLFATLQLVLNLTLIGMPVPAIVMSCYASLIGIANLNMIPKAYIEDFLSHFVTN